MKLDLDYIKKLSCVMDEKSLVEVTIQDGTQMVCLKKGEMSPVKVAAVQPEEVDNTFTTVEEVETQDTKKNVKTITSPMVGTFYSAPSQGAEPFVKLGDTVAEGQVVCIVEAMKLMNEIESDVAGRVVEICVKNGETVEFGQVLMYIE